MCISLLLCVIRMESFCVLTSSLSGTSIYRPPFFKFSYIALVILPPLLTAYPTILTVEAFEFSLSSENVAPLDIGISSSGDLLLWYSSVFLCVSLRNSVEFQGIFVF